MSRTNRIALLGAAILVVALAGSALANRAPTAQTPTAPLADDPEPVDEAAVDQAVQRLSDAGVEAATPELVTELATEHGVGGAVRILAWADAGVATVEELVERRAAGEGWGQIAKNLGVHPGIGSIMGNGGGLGRENAPGQQRDRGTGD